PRPGRPPAPPPGARARPSEVAPMTLPAVWITGVGTATPLGHTFDANADALLAGRSAVRPVAGFDVRDHPSQVAAQLDSIPCPAGDDPAGLAHLPRLERLVRWCCSAALRDSGWWQRRAELRVGLALGVGAEWLLLWEADAHAGGRAVWEPHAD